MAAGIGVLVDSAPAAAILGEPYGLYPGVDAEGNVYVLDAQAKSLVSFDRDGRVRWRTARPATSPADSDLARVVADDRITARPCRRAGMAVPGRGERRGIGANPTARR